LACGQDNGCCGKQRQRVSSHRSPLKSYARRTARAQDPFIRKILGSELAEVGPNEEPCFLYDDVVEKAHCRKKAVARSFLPFASSITPMLCEAWYRGDEGKAVGFASRRLCCLSV
jgi:hypothetical protein